MRTGGMRSRESIERRRNGMSRLIDAEILFEKVGNIKPKNKSEYELLGKFMNMITYSPTLPNPCGKPCAFERPHGEWLTEPHSRIIHCSNCGAEENMNKLHVAKWCYSCGADMRGEAE